RAPCWRRDGSRCASRTIWFKIWRNARFLRGFHCETGKIKVLFTIMHYGERSDMTVTIYDVAREANVSMATVSRVVNNNPNVKPQTRKRVYEAIEKLGYRPNA